MTMATKPQSKPALTRSQQLFQNATTEIQAILKSVLAQEREVRHLQRRHNIHQDILDHVKKLVR